MFHFNNMIAEFIGGLILFLKGKNHLFLPFEIFTDSIAIQNYYTIPWFCSKFEMEFIFSKMCRKLGSYCEKNISQLKIRISYKVMKGEYFKFYFHPSTLHLMVCFHWRKYIKLYWHITYATLSWFICSH